MILTEKQKESFELVVLPLINWLKSNTHPHCHAIINQTHAEISEGFFVCIDPLSVQETPCCNCKNKFHYQKINERELCQECDKLIK